MIPIEAISLTSAVNHWLTNTRQPRLLHIFDRACNLINERKEILSVVTPDIGNGPFNLVVKADILFTGYLSIESAVSVSANDITLGSLNIPTSKAKLWNAIPDWDALHSERDNISAQLTKLPITNYSSSILQSSNSLASSLANADLSSSLMAAKELAGLGQGLTPSGDDFIMGALHAAWIIHPAEIASVLTSGIADVAAPLTTSLSAAWLKSAGRGEAGILWHKFFDALVAGDEIRIADSVEKILAVGETSGADALAGFVSVFSADKNSASAHESGAKAPS